MSRSDGRARNIERIKSFFQQTETTESVFFVSLFLGDIADLVYILNMAMAIVVCGRVEGSNGSNGLNVARAPLARWRDLVAGEWSNGADDESH